MSAQDLEQRARGFLAAEYERDGKAGSANHIRTQPLLPNKARALRAIVAALRQQPAPVVDDAMRDLIEQRDTLLNALKRALPHVEHAYHTHEDLDGSFWIDVVGCRSALARAQGVQS